MKKALILSLALLVMCLFTLPALAWGGDEFGSKGGAFQEVIVTITPINENIAMTGDAMAGNMAITSIRSCTMAHNNVNANTNAIACGNDGVDGDVEAEIEDSDDDNTALAGGAALVCNRAGAANAEGCAVALSCNSVSNYGVAHANSGDATATQYSPSNTVDACVFAVGGVNLELPD